MTSFHLSGLRPVCYHGSASLVDLRPRRSSACLTDGKPESYCTRGERPVLARDYECIDQVGFRPRIVKQLSFECRARIPSA
jgi:hypothetical protein